MPNIPIGKGQWVGGAAMRAPASPASRPIDPTKPPGRGQQAPLTPEYQAIYEASLADQATAARAPGARTAACRPACPRMMTAIRPIEFVVTAGTYLYPDRAHPQPPPHLHRRPRLARRMIEPASLGYSIGKWLDEKGDGRFDVLEVETRGIQRSAARSIQPACRSTRTTRRSSRSASISTQTIPDILRDDITTIDHALTRPWSVTKTYTRDPGRKPVWRELICAEGNPC